MDYAQDDTEVKVAWDSHNSGESKDVQGICLVTGERAEIARIHRGIKGVPGAQSSGAALFPLMHLRLSHMERSKAIMLR